MLDLALHPAKETVVSNLGLAMRVKVVKALTPFNMGQAIVVERTNPSTSSYAYAERQLPSHFLLKLFDRRFSAVRTRPWKPSLETKMRSCLCQIALGERSPPPALCLGGPGIDEDGEKWEDTELEDCLPRGFEPWMSELASWESLDKSFRKEVRAYLRLSNLYGTAVPTFYGNVTIHVNDSFGVTLPSLPSHWTFEPSIIRGLALEYIDGMSVTSLERGIHLSDAEAMQFAEDSFDVMRDLSRLGVAHNDLNAHNVIARKDGSRWRPFVIDFGLSQTLGHDFNDEEWARLGDLAQPWEIYRSYYDEGFWSLDWPKKSKADLL